MDTTTKYVDTFSNKEAFDWNKILNRKEYTREIVWEATILAADWPTCACGNQCAIIPRHPGGAPKDAELYELGREFSDKFDRLFRKEFTAMDPGIVIPRYNISQYLYGIKQILTQIEARSTFLINQIKAENGHNH